LTENASRGRITKFTLNRPYALARRRLSGGACGLNFSLAYVGDEDA